MTVAGLKVSTCTENHLIVDKLVNETTKKGGVVDPSTSRECRRSVRITYYTRTTPRWRIHVTAVIVAAGVRDVQKQTIMLY